MRAQRKECKGRQRWRAGEPIPRFERRLCSAKRSVQRGRIITQLLAGRRQLRQVRLFRDLAPQAQSDVQNVEIILEAVIENAQGRFEVRGGKKSQRRAVQLFADAVVLTAELYQFPQLGFELAVLLAQADDLTLGDRDRVAAVRMRNINFGQEIGVLREELRVLLEIIGDVIRVHRR